MPCPWEVCQVQPELFEWNGRPNPNDVSFEIFLSNLSGDKVKVKRKLAAWWDVGTASSQKIERLWKTQFNSIQFNSCHTSLPCLEWSEPSQRHGFLVAAGHPNLHLEKLVLQLVTGLQINVALWKTGDFTKRYLQSGTMWTTKEQESKWNLEKIHKKNPPQHHSTSLNITEHSLANSRKTCGPRFRRFRRTWGSVSCDTVTPSRVVNATCRNAWPKSNRAKKKLKTSDPLDSSPCVWV